MKRTIFYISLFFVIALFIVFTVRKKTANSFYKLNGEFFQNNDQPLKAVKWYNRIQNGNRDVDLLLNMADCYSQLDDYTNLVKVYRNICFVTNEESFLKTLIWLEKETGDFNSGIEDTRKLISINPNSWRYKQLLVIMMIDADLTNQLKKTVTDFENNMSKTASNDFQIAKLWQRIDMNSNAVSHFEKCVKENPSNDEWRLALADAQTENKQLTRALTNLLMIVDNYSEDDKLIGTIGFLYNSLGNDDKAIEYYRRSIRLNQQGYLALNNLAYILLLQNDNIDEAYELAQSSVQLKQKSFTVDTLAYAYYKLGKYKTALRYLKKAEKLLKQEGRKMGSEMEYHVGIAHAGLGEFDKATAKINAALLKDHKLEELLKKEPFYPEIKSRITIK